jgi:hypothetical protein
MMLLTGCTRDAPFSVDSRIATRQANQLLPKSTPEARAKKLLSQRGFTLSRMNSDQDKNHLLVATRTDGRHTWLVGVVIIDDRVAACSVTVTTD